MQRRADLMFPIVGGSKKSVDEQVLQSKPRGDSEKQLP